MCITCRWLCVSIKNVESLKDAKNNRTFWNNVRYLIEYRKNRGYSFGPLKNSLRYVDGIRMTNNPNISLGIFIGQDKEANNEKNG